MKNKIAPKCSKGNHSLYNIITATLPKILFLCFFQATDCRRACYNVHSVRYAVSVMALSSNDSSKRIHLRKAQQPPTGEQSGREGKQTGSKGVWKCRVGVAKPVCEKLQQPYIYSARVNLRTQNPVRVVVWLAAAGERWWLKSWNVCTKAKALKPRQQLCPGLSQLSLKRESQKYNNPVPPLETVHGEGDLKIK